MRGPTVRPGTLPRPRLAAQIDAALSQGTRLVNVQAPRGYGKTTAAAQWARTADERIVWVPLWGTHDEDGLWSRLASELTLPRSHCRRGSKVGDAVGWAHHDSLRRLSPGDVVLSR